MSSLFTGVQIYSNLRPIPFDIQICEILHLYYEMIGILSTFEEASRYVISF